MGHGRHFKPEAVFLPWYQPRGPGVDSSQRFDSPLRLLHPDKVSALQPLMLSTHVCVSAAAVVAVKAADVASLLFGS